MFLNFRAPINQSVILSNPSWFWLVFATHVVAEWHLFGFLGLPWDPSVADLGQPRTQLFNFLVPWGRLGVTKTSFLVLRGLAGTNLEPLRCRFFNFGGGLGLTSGPSWGGYLHFRPLQPSNPMALSIPLSPSIPQLLEIGPAECAQAFK